MGLSALPANSRVYLDASIWIYALEGYAAYAVPLKTLFARIDTGEITAITSALSLAEVLVKPFADGNTALQRLYADTLQDRPSLSIVPLTRAVLIKAARLRAQYALQATARELEVLRRRLRPFDVNGPGRSESTVHVSTFPRPASEKTGAF